MNEINKQLENILVQGPAKDIILYNNSYYVLELIASNHEVINGSEYVKFFALVQKNSLDSLFLSLCRMYEKSDRNINKSFYEISKFIKRHKKTLAIYNTKAATKFINQSYNLRDDFILDSNDPIVDKETNLSISNSMLLNLPDEITNHRYFQHFKKIWKIRSKEIAHNDIDSISDRPTFEGMRLLLDNAINIVNALTQIYCNAINMTPELEYSLIEDGKNASKALTKIINEILPQTTPLI